MKLDAVTKNGIVSPETVKYWKDKAANLLIRKFDLPNTQWKVSKRSIKNNPRLLLELRQIGARMKNFAGTKFVLGRSDLLSLAEASGLPAETRKAYYAKTEGDRAKYGEFKVQYEDLDDEVQRFKAVVAKKEARVHAEALKRKVQEAAAEKIRKRKVQQDKKKIKSGVQQLKTRTRAQKTKYEDKHPPVEHKRSRTRDRGAAAHRGRGTGKRPSEARESSPSKRGKLQPRSRAGKKKEAPPTLPPSSKRVKTGKPSIASNPSPFIRNEDL